MRNISSTALFANIGHLYMESEMSKSELAEVIAERDYLKQHNETLTQENTTLRVKLQAFQEDQNNTSEPAPEDQNNGPTAG